MATPAVETARPSVLDGSPRSSSTPSSTDGLRALTVRQVGELTGGFSPKTVRGWMRDGRLPSFLLGGQRRVLSSDVDAFLVAEKERSAAEDAARRCPPSASGRILSADPGDFFAEQGRAA